MSLFKHNGKKVDKEDILREIYENHLQKKAQITDMVSAITPLIKTTADVINILPDLTKLTVAGIQNDDMLLKMINILSKSDKKKADDDGFGFVLSDDDRKQLLEIASKSKIDDTIPSGGK